MFRICIAITLAIGLGGCVSQAEYEAAKKQRNDARAELAELEKAIPELERNAADLATVRAQLTSDREKLNDFIQMASIELTKSHSFVLRFFGEVLNVASAYAVAVDDALAEANTTKAQIEATLERARESVQTSKDQIQQANDAIARIEAQRTSLFNSLLNIAAPIASTVPGGGAVIGLLGTIAGAGGLGMFGIKARESNHRKKIIQATEEYNLISDDPSLEPQKEKARLSLGGPAYAELKKITRGIGKKKA